MMSCNEAMMLECKVLSVPFTLNFSYNPSLFRVRSITHYTPPRTLYLACQIALHLVVCTPKPFLPVFTFFCKTILATDTILCSGLIRPATLVRRSHFFSMGVLPSYIHTSLLARLLQATPVVYGFNL